MIYRVETQDTEGLRMILTIHDEMPLVWDPTHRPSQEFTEKLITEIQARTEPQGFWILAKSKPLSIDSVDGILWATVKKSHVNLVCSIASLWIRPELRNEKLTHHLTDACLSWAKEHRAQRLVCSTHSENSRMREILEKNDFAPEMISFTRNL